MLPPGAAQTGWADCRDLELVAVDPAGSLDLDQAFGAERRGEGYRVHYAIADVAAFVGPDTVLEAASLERGVTLYPREVAMLMRSARGLRGAGDVSLGAGVDDPATLTHSAIASIYAHVTAPTRRSSGRSDRNPSSGRRFESGW